MCLCMCVCAKKKILLKCAENVFVLVKGVSLSTHFFRICASPCLTNQPHVSRVQSLRKVAEEVRKAWPHNSEG